MIAHMKLQAVILAIAQTQKVKPIGLRQEDSLMRRVGALIVAVLGLLVYLAPSAVLYDVWCAFWALLALPFAIIPLEIIITALQISPPATSILALFLLGTLLLGLVELG